MNPNVNKRFTIKRKKYTQSQINRCGITIKVMNSRGKHETEHKTMEIPWREIEREAERERDREQERERLTD